MNENARQSARKFVEYWTFQRGSEKGEDQQFWNSLLGEVLGMADVKTRIKYQVPVPMAGGARSCATDTTTKFLDAWIPETRVLIEHKSRGVKLDAPQSGHDGKTPFEQALEYNIARPFSEKARWIVTCNFDEIWVYDLDKPLAEPQKIRLADLPKEVSRLGFLVDSTVKTVREKEKDISIKAGRIVGEIYKALLKRYQPHAEGKSHAEAPRGRERREDLTTGASPQTPRNLCGLGLSAPLRETSLAALNRLCVRLVFCFYAEDAEIFPKDCFWSFLKNTPAQFLRGRLADLFKILDTKPEDRPRFLDDDIAVFPYTNGGLFAGAAEDDIPPLTEEIRQLLIRSSDFDWRDISPTIFGALFESTLNPVTRRAGGMVYTSVENIHKVIDPLFLDALTERVEEATGNSGLSGKSGITNRRELLALQAEMAALTFLDPACGSGNFLTETYICLRRLENRIIAALQRGQREFDLGLSVKVSIAQFFGLEINDFAVAVAKTALWIAEAQMLRETAEILHREPDYLPLHDYDGIVEGNALRMDWARIGLPSTDVQIVEVRAGVLFQDAKARLSELKEKKVEVVNSAGDCFRFTKQIFKALSDKARDQSVARSVHWAAVAAIDRLCAASTFLWDEKPRNGSVDIDRNAKHGVCFRVDGVPFVAKITSKVYPGDAAHVTYSVEAVLVEKNDARGMTDSIARGQSLDPSAVDRILNFSESVKGATAKRHFDYIMGNPPFVGLSFRTKEQAADMDAVYADWKDTNYGKLDYVCAWYKKAVNCILAAKNAKDTKVAFVSTNSICQGECVAAMWEPMFTRANVEIDFAWRTFRWDNETIASEKAHVHCVIVGFHAGGRTSSSAVSAREDTRPPKRIFTSDPKDADKPPTIVYADHINGYLLDADDVFMRNRGTPPDGFPKLAQGSKPWDGGNLILSVEQRDALLASHPDAESFIKRYLGAEDLIKNKLRYCLWLLDVSPAKYRGIPEIMRRLAAVAEIRRTTKTVAVRKQADTPYLFSQIRQPQTDYLVVPETSSGARHYIPVGFMPKDVIASNSVMTMANATPYLFGVLSSSAHTFWMRTVAGRLKSDYRYTPSVYNNFPWPDESHAKSAKSAKDAGGQTLRTLRTSREAISSTAQAILDARARYPDSSLADLYDPLTMPADLRAAHAANDRAVLAAYGLAPDTPEPEIVAHLFRLYAQMTEKEKESRQ